MAISARLPLKTQRALARYCRRHGITKTEALERGIAFLLQEEKRQEKHPAFVAFERLRAELRAVPARQLESVATLKRRLDEKYPG
jgi:hypothetical protein